MRTPIVSRAHDHPVSDGGAHLHVWFFARPLGQSRLLGSRLVWDDLLAEYPAHLADAAAAVVANVWRRSMRLWTPWLGESACQGLDAA